MAGRDRPAGRRPLDLDTPRASRTVAPCPGRQGDGLHAEARWDGFGRFLADGRICLTKNAAERALRGIALGRKAWLFAGSDRGGARAAFMYGLIATAKLNDVDPQAWLADVLARIADTPATRLDDFLPWNWRPASARLAA